MKTLYIKPEKKPFPYQRPYSWSQHSSFAYSPKQWFLKYCMGEETPPSQEMLYGNVIGTRLASDPLFLPEVERASIFEQELRGKVGDIELLGYLDSFCPEKKLLIEYKTSRNKKAWTHTTANKHGQINFYCYLIYHTYKIKPEDLTIKLIYIPTHIHKGSIAISGEPVQTFAVKKTMADILSFANEIKTRRQEMIDFYNEFNYVSDEITEGDFFAK